MLRRLTQLLLRGFRLPLWADDSCNTSRFVKLVEEKLIVEPEIIGCGGGM